GTDGCRNRPHHGRAGRAAALRAETHDGGNPRCNQDRPTELRESRAMIEAAMIWNEPNNKSHWDVEIDPDWSLFAEMAIGAADAIASVNPDVTRVLGGISPIDALFIQNMQGKGVLDHVDAVA